jgi:hypothetical protein
MSGCSGLCGDAGCTDCRPADRPGLLLLAALFALAAVLVFIGVTR